MPTDLPMSEMSACCGCGAVLEVVDGPTHDYMRGSPACFRLFGDLLAFEYLTPDDPQVQMFHRLSVDTYAVQHPGDTKSRRQIQSVGLHLARLMLQLDNPRPPKETNDVMLGLGRDKQTLEWLAPPNDFAITIADVHPFAGGAQHVEKVREWAGSAWADWGTHHDYIRTWVRDRSIS
jgi:hypothetical protein